MEQRLSEAIRRGVFTHFTEQTALNVAIYTQKTWPCFLPPRFNWICFHALPGFDERSGLYVEPELPHDEIGIMHMAGGRQLHSDLDFSYSQFLIRRRQYLLASAQ
jgi:hypothetical protein